MALFFSPAPSLAGSALDTLPRVIGFGVTYDAPAELPDGMHYQLQGAALHEQPVINGNHVIQNCTLKLSVEPAKDISKIAGLARRDGFLWMGDRVLSEEIMVWVGEAYLPRLDLSAQAAKLGCDANLWRAPTN